MGNLKEANSCKELSLKFFKVKYTDFLRGAVVKNPPADAGDMSLIPGLARSHMPQSS